mmetsp:Transcript_12553/g.27138  ORF Transcript_12553/g.27138 Transcript_12553/m.27138 type:complete len:559 (-) Transcript_12553:134-1810(-)
MSGNGNITTAASAAATADTASSFSGTADFSFVDVDGAVPALSLSVTPRHDTIGIGSGLKSTQVCVTVKARDLPDDDENGDQTRASVDIVVALDVSGSMAGDKLDQCKETLELLLRALLPRDRFGLITFASDARIDIPAQSMTAQNKEAALRKIKALQTRGCTNISAAIGLASQEMKMIESANEVRTIFLLTDGHANEGMTDAKDVTLATKRCLVEGVSSFDADTSTSTSKSGDRCLDGFMKKLSVLSPSSSSSSIPKDISMKSETKDDSPPISLHCFGYGVDHDSQFLRQVSNATPGGTYYFVKNDSNVGAAFGDALGGILSVVAQSAMVNIKVLPEASNLGVTVKIYHADQLQRGMDLYSVTLGDFYAEESRDVVFDLALATPLKGKAGGDGSSIPHVQITLAATDAIQKRPLMIGPVTCSVKRPDANDISEANHHVLVQWLRVYATQEMADAEKLASDGKLAAARAKVQKAMQTIQGTPGVDQSHGLVRQLTAELETISEGLSSRHTYSSGGAHYIHRSLQTHTYQRCAEDTHETPNVYRSSNKASMSLAFSPRKK